MSSPAEPREAGAAAVVSAEREPAGRLSVELVTSLGGLAALEQEWEELFRASSSPTPFMSWEWHYHWCRTYRPGERMRVVLVREPGGRLAGVAPLMRVPGTWGWLGLREMRFLSDFRGSCLGCTDFLVRPGWEAAALGAVCGHLAEDQWWDRLRLSPIWSGSAGLWEFVRQAAGVELRTEVRLHSWQRQARLGRSFEEQLAGYSRNRRRRLRASMRGLARRHEFRLQTAHDEGEVRAVIGWLAEHKRERMRRKGEWTWFDDPRYERFLADFSVGALAKGRGRLLTVWLDGGIGGCALLFVTGKHATFYYHGFSFEHQSEHAIDAIVGFVMEACIEEGLEVLDFMWGDPRHHYAKERTSAMQLLVYRPRARSLVFEGLAHAAAPAWRAGRVVLPRRVSGAVLRRVKRESPGGPAEEEPEGRLPLA